MNASRASGLLLLLLLLLLSLVLLPLLQHRPPLKWEKCCYDTQAAMRGWTRPNTEEPKEAISLPSLMMLLLVSHATLLQQKKTKGTPALAQVLEALEPEELPPPLGTPCALSRQDC